MKTRIVAVLGTALLTSLSSELLGQETAPATDTRSSPSARLLVSQGVIPSRTGQQTNLTPWVSQILKLSQAGIDERVVLTFVDSAGTFDLTSEQIITLTQAGVNREVISAMLEHDADLKSGAKPMLAPSPPDSAGMLKFSPLAVPTIASEAVPEKNDFLAGFNPDSGRFFDDAFVIYPDAPIDDQSGVRSPVRKPYAVQLTDPIVVYRGYRPMANTMLLVPLQ